MRTALARAACLIVCLSVFGLPCLATDAEKPAVVKTVVDLQQFRRTETNSIVSVSSRQGKATLVNLNPDINSWFLLTLDRGGGDQVNYHIENADPAGQQLHLGDTDGTGLSISKDGRIVKCALWSDKPSPLDRARASTLPYAPLCEGRLYLRNQVVGHQSELERVTDFLRDRVWNGDAIVGFVRDNLYRDAFRETGERTEIPVAAGPPAAGAPISAALGQSYSGMAVAPKDLGIAFAAAPGAHLLGLGHWYPAQDIRGVYVSVIQPEAADPGRHAAPSNLDSVEASALDYLVAFDLSEYDLGFALGTDHPRLGWSARVGAPMRDDRPGPDGIAGSVPLVRTGMVAPAVLDRVAATFTGGFKREHGAFKYGDLAKQNQGSHYGFVEQGVVFSRLQPGLATLYGVDDGSIQMKTWSEADAPLLAHMKFARQNGVALVEPDATGEPAAGKFVGNWGFGNWSGSADEKLRTLRAGACLQESGNRRFLIYGYFSTATPSAMARVFLSYGCRYAMLLDINALEHTYLALYRRQGDSVAVEHLIPGMSELDKSVGGRLIPRFIGFPDNRDFFYVIRRRSTR